MRLTLFYTFPFTRFFGTQKRVENMHILDRIGDIIRRLGLFADGFAKIFGLQLILIRNRHFDEFWLFARHINGKAVWMIGRGINGNLNLNRSKFAHNDSLLIGAPCVAIMKDK